MNLRHFALLVSSSLVATSARAQQPPTAPTVTVVTVRATPTTTYVDLVLPRATTATLTTEPAAQAAVVHIRGAAIGGAVTRAVRAGNIVSVTAVPESDTTFALRVKFGYLRVAELTYQDSLGAWVLAAAGTGETLAPTVLSVAPDRVITTIAAAPDSATRGGQELRTNNRGTIDDRTDALLTQWDAQADSAHVDALWDRTPLRDALAVLSTFAHRSIIAGAGTDTVTVSGDYRNARWTDVLRTLARVNGLRLRVDAGNIITLELVTTIAQTDENTPLETKAFRLAYGETDAIADALKANITARGKISAIPASRTILVRDVPDALNRVAALLPLLDVPERQILVSTTILQVNESIARDLGVIYDAAGRNPGGNSLGAIPIPTSSTGTTTGSSTTNGPQSGDPNYFNTEKGITSTAIAAPLPQPVSPTFQALITTLAGNFSLTTLVQALESRSLARVIARQQGRVRDGKTFEGMSGERTPLTTVGFATGSNGSQTGVAGQGTTGSTVGSVGGTGTSGTNGSGGIGAVPYTTVGLEETGVKLQVTPHTEPGDQIALDIKVERSSAVPSGIGSAGVQFLINTYNTFLRADDGQTVMLGGLQDSNQGEQVAGIPILMHLPFIGQFFRSTSKSSTDQTLLIFVTATILPN